MSVQNQILQSLHSTWVDELNKKFPDLKLELGLPKRVDGWVTLDPEYQAQISVIETDGVRGLGAWAISAEQKLSELQALAKNTLEACIAYIRTHHQVDLKCGPIQDFNSKIDPPTRTIWFPIAIQTPGKSLVFDLGVGF